MNQDKYSLLTQKPVDRFAVEIAVTYGGILCLLSRVESFGFLMLGVLTSNLSTLDGVNGPRRVRNTSWLEFAGQPQLTRSL
jgi:hypothetical protein